MWDLHEHLAEGVVATTPTQCMIGIASSWWQALSRHHLLPCWQQPNPSEWDLKSGEDGECNNDDDDNKDHDDVVAAAAAQNHSQVRQCLT
jgi:hypothetical protein